MLMVALAPPASALQVCVGDVPVLPYLSGDPKKPGITERLMVDTGRQVGLPIELIRWPARRCYEQMRQGALDAGVGAAIPANMQEFDFPGAPTGDPQLRIARTSLVLVGRQDTVVQWDGHKLELPQGQTPRIGARAGFRASLDAIHRLGLELTPGSPQSSQVLLMVLRNRLDFAVLVQEEADALLSRPEHAGLIRLDPPLQVTDFYVMTSRKLPEAQRPLVRRWWELMAQWRDLPAYRAPVPAPGPATAAPSTTGRTP